MKIITTLILTLGASAALCMDHSQSVQEFHSHYENELTKLLNTRKESLFHPQQPDPVKHALDCIPLDNFSTYLHLTNDRITGAISMGTFKWQNQYDYVIVNFLTYKHKEVGRFLLRKAIEQTKKSGIKSLALYIMIRNLPLKTLCLEEGGRLIPYSKLQEVIEFDF